MGKKSNSNLLALIVFAISVFATVGVTVSGASTLACMLTLMPAAICVFIMMYDGNSLWSIFRSYSMLKEQDGDNKNFRTDGIYTLTAVQQEIVSRFKKASKAAGAPVTVKGNNIHNVWGHKYRGEIYFRYVKEKSTYLRNKNKWRCVKVDAVADLSGLSITLHDGSDTYTI